MNLILASIDEISSQMSYFLLLINGKGKVKLQKISLLP